MRSMFLRPGGKHAAGVQRVHVLPHLLDPDGRAELSGTMAGERAHAAMPVAPEIPTELARTELTELAHDARLLDVELDHAELAGGWAVGVSIRGAALHAVDLSGSELEQLHVLDATLRGCNLANVQARRASLVRVTATGCRLTGISLFEAFVRDVTFAGCRIDLASFGSCRLQQLTFEDCVLTQTDFLQSELQSVRFHGCDLTQADFRGAQLDRCELRGCELEGAHGIDRLAGSAMPWTDIVQHAGTWAAALGIEVLDEE
jgi:uncharacterized protein YjbI with pentapeptide repeats